PGQALVVSEPQEHPPERGGRKTRVRHRRLLPVEGVERMRADCARSEGGHGEAPVKRPAIVLLCARLGRFHLLIVVGGRAPPTGGGPAGSASSASVRLADADPSPGPRLRALDALAGFLLPRYGEIRRFVQALTARVSGARAVSLRSRARLL
ncbi:MAG: hypothetical protein ACRDMH_17265, partial [Solirubrobacterales bacterium]